MRSDKFVALFKHNNNLIQITIILNYASHYFTEVYNTKKSIQTYLLSLELWVNLISYHDPDPGY